MSVVQQLKDLLAENVAARSAWSNVVANEAHTDDEFQAEHGFKTELVDQYGGEDCGSEYWYVFSIEKDGVKEFAKLDGWYQSFHGNDWDDITDFYKVEKKPITVESWEKS